MLLLLLLLLLQLKYQLDMKVLYVAWDTGKFLNGLYGDSKEVLFSIGE